jgi:23S rRNA pseudouridine2605 synthase
MNDSTPEIPAVLPPVEVVDASAPAKKPAAKRAPRKKPVAAAEAVVVAEGDPAPELAVVAESVEAALVAAEASTNDAPVAAAVPTGPAPRRTESRAQGNNGKSPRPQDAGRDKRRAPAPMVQGYQFEDVISGRFDEDEVADDAVPAKRVLLPQVETPKLHKVLAQAGLGSRLEMEQLILEGRISVNNEPAHVGQRIQFGDQVKVNGKPIRYRIDPPPARVIAYHKPVGEVVTNDDPQNRPTVFRKLPRLMHGKWQSVGRLDLNTEGLLLFTSSGELANKLMHPRFGLEREYAVRVLGALSKEEKQKLLDGVRLDDGMAAFGSIEDGGGEGSNCWYRVTISEGRNREVRRMLEAVGHAVSRLIRIRYGAMVLPRGLKRGAWMELDDSDIRALMRAVGADRHEPSESASGAVEGVEGQSYYNNRAQRDRSNAPRGAEGPRRSAGPNGPAGARGANRPRRDGGNASGQGARGNNAGDGDRQRIASQPDPMKTSVGYIGGDSLSRQRQEQRRPMGGGPRRRGGR